MATRTKRQESVSDEVNEFGDRPANALITDYADIDNTLMSDKKLKRISKGGLVRTHNMAPEAFR